MSQPPYPPGASRDPVRQPPADPFQQPGYPGAGYPGYPPTQPAYPAAPPYPSAPAYQHPGQYPTFPIQPTYPGHPPTQPAPPAPPAYPGQPAYPGYPPAPPAQPARRGPTVVIVTVVALLLVLVVGGGVAAAYLFSRNGSTRALGGGTPASSASLTPSAPAPAPGPTHGGDLRAFLVPRPDGAKKCANEEGTDGALSLSQAANLSTEPTKRAAELREYMFTGGAVRCWVTGDQILVDVRLYQFDSTDHAAEFFDADVRGTKPLYQPENVTDIAGVPGGQSFGNPTPDSDGDVQVISIALRGDIVLVAAVRQSPPLTTSAAESVLSAQYQKL